MEDRTSNYYIIQSADRLTGSAENCTVRNQNFSDSFSYRFTKAIIPFTFYNITSFNNVLVITFGVGSSTITIPIGQYSINLLLANIQTQLNAIGTGVFTVSYNPTSFLVSIVNDTTNFSYLGLSSTINDVIGFQALNTGFSMTQIGSYIFNLSGTDWIDIVSTTLTNSESKTRYSSYGGANVLARIPTSQYSFGQTIFYQPFHEHQWTSRMNLQENIDLRLIDDYGNELNLNGRDWSIVLKYHTHKSNNSGNDSRTYKRDGDSERFFIN